MNPRKELHYDLFLRGASTGFYWKLRDQGITLDADGLSYSINGVPRRYRYDELRQVRLVVTTGGRSGHVFACILHFNDGKHVAVHSGDASGLADPEREVVYRDFVRVLHARLSTLKLAHIDFAAGQTQTRYYIGLVAGIAMIAMFVVLPLGLLLVLWELEALFVLVAGAAFAWPMWKLVQAGRPRGYSPDDLPEDLVPAGLS